MQRAWPLRELEWAFEQDGHAWTKAQQNLLIESNLAVQQAGGYLEAAQAESFQIRYRTLLQQADSECPPSDPGPSPPPRTAKRSKSRNFLERLRNFEAETSRFLTDPNAPFTNNQSENDIRMTKVHQKISRCFRSPEGAAMFCRIRSFLSTCRKQGIFSTWALTSLFQPHPLDFDAFFA